MSAPPSPPDPENCQSPTFAPVEDPLPPLPPLQRAPGIKCTPAALVERGGTSGTKIAVVANFLQAGNKMTVIGDGVSMFPVRLSSRSASDNDGVSRLVMKNVSKVTGKRKALIHSIPKFSQVLPNPQLAEAQRVLQERLLKKAGVTSEAGEMKASSMLLTLVDRREKEAGGMGSGRQVEEKGKMGQEEEAASSSFLQEKDIEGQRTDVGVNPWETDAEINSRRADMGLNSLDPDVRCKIQGDTMASNMQKIRNKQERETAKQLQTSEMDVNSRPRRERKPRKTAICHFLPSSPSPSLPSLSEVTITPRYQDQETKTIYQDAESSASYQDQDRTARYQDLDRATIHQDEDRTSQYQDEDVGAPLDLCIRRTPTPEMIEVNCDPLIMSFGSDPNYNPETESDNPSPSLDTGSNPSPESHLSPPYIPILHPADYERLAGENPLYSTYIFLPSAGVFVHPLALPTELNPHLTSQPQPQIPPLKKTFQVPPATTSFSLNGSTTVHRIKKQENPIHPDHIPSTDQSTSLQPVFSSYKKLVPSKRRKRSAPFQHQPSDNSGEVSICKFKFTGGARPSLEEKKMLSVDSGGNFRYYNGERSGRGFEFCSPAINHIKNNERFSKNTQDQQEEGKGRQKKLSLGAVDLIGAFESMPERTGRNGGDIGIGGQGKRGRKKAPEGHQVST